MPSRHGEGVWGQDLVCARGLGGGRAIALVRVAALPLAALCLLLLLLFLSTEFPHGRFGGAWEGDILNLGWGGDDGLLWDVEEWFRGSA